MLLISILLTYMLSNLGLTMYRDGSSLFDLLSLEAFNQDDDPCGTFGMLK